MKKGARKGEDLSGTIVTSPNLESGLNLDKKNPPFSSSENDNLWFLAFNAVEDAISILDDDFKIVRCNQAMQKLTGLDNHALVGKHCFDVLHNHQHPLPNCPIQKMRQTLQRESIELPFGSRWVEITIDPVFSSEGKIEGAVQNIRDITNRKETEEKLIESELRVKKKLEAMLSPDLEVGDIELADIIDSKEIQEVMDDFHRITHIGVGVIDVKGKVLVANGWQDICTCFHRKHPETYQNCIDSDTVLSLPDINNIGGIKAYKCKNNMWDISTPIIVGGKHLGNIFLGQFLYDDEEPNIDVFREQSRKYGFDEEKYLEALKNVPRWTHETVNAVMSFYSRLSILISNLSFVNLKLAKTIEERNRAVDELKSNYSLLRMAGKLARFGGWSLNLDETRVTWSDEVALIHEMRPGYSPSLTEGIKFYAPEWQDTVLEAITQCAEKGISFDEELELVTAKGKRIWVRAIGEPVRDENGRIYKIEGAFQNIHDRKIMEKALLESEGNARAIMESTDDVIVLLKRDGTVIDSNEGHARKLGFKRTDLIGQNVFQFLPFEVADRRKTFVQTVLDTEKPFYGEDCRENIWTEISIHPIFDENKAVDRVAVFGHDITARKQVEEALRKSEELLNFFMTYTPVYTFIKEVIPGKSQVVKASENFREMVGIPGAQMDGKDMFELFPAEFAKKVTDDDWKVVSEGKVLVLDEELNGRSYTTIKFPILESGRNFLAGFTIDDTDRKQVEREVKRMNSLLAATLESTADGILVVDRTGNISSYNKKFMELWQISGEEIPDHEDSKMISLISNQLKDAEEFKKRVEELYLNRAENSFDIIEFKDGRVFERYSQAQRLDGEIIGRVWSFRDVTKQKHDERALKENEMRLKELNATKDRLFSIIAHDLRNPFNSIVGFSNLLCAQIAEKDYDGIERYAQIIQDSSEQALDILQNILEWSRSQTGRLSFSPEKIDITKEIRQAAELLHSTALHKSISMYLNTASQQWVHADKAMIDIVLRNLISNAIKFTQREGEIEISAKQIGEDLVVSIIDNGVGISEEAISKLFRIDSTHSTFGTQNEKGTGLGLILCKELIDKHNGRIWVESEINKGSKFYFSIPMSVK